jgi:hypothetical protein
MPNVKPNILTKLRYLLQLMLIYYRQKFIDSELRTLQLSLTHAFNVIILLSFLIWRETYEL